jgi:tRNA-splicing endonuclease subunit Sen34
VELMPEEARLLVEKKVAYVADDVAAHRKAFLERGLSVEERKAYHAALRKQGLAAAKDASKRGDDRKRAALAKKAEYKDWNDVPEDMLPSSREQRRDKTSEGTANEPKDSPGSEEEVLFASATDSILSRSSNEKSTVTDCPGPELFLVTPTTSNGALQSISPASGQASIVTEALPSYPLFKHLHDQGYFLSPGLRFGCHFVAYPGDPLRFHSHFLCNGMDWDQEFDLLDLVGGGRLGTGVKKGFMIGGRDEERGAADGGDDPGGAVRPFSIEWGGM